MDRRSTKSLWRDYGVPMQDPKAFSLQYYKDTSKDPSKPIKKKPTKKVDYTDHTGLLKIDKPKKAQEGLKIAKPDYTEMGTGFINRNNPTVQNDLANDPSLVRMAKSGEIPEYIGGNAPSPGVSKYIGGYGSGKTMEWLVNTTVKNPEWLAWEAAKKAKPGYIPRQIRNTINDIINMGKGIKNLEQPDIGSGLLPGLVISLMKRRFTDKPIYDLNNVDKKQIGGKMIGLLKKGGKVGDPKNRKKPGGSNVGKYSKAEGPFAGPSGGAPSGSYPIGSKARGKSALKLAHNAPNPGGIKAAVYRKYPELKTKKAAYGAKLGLLGMGQMQGKAPIPTDRNAPTDKVHTNFKMTKRKRKEPKTAFPH
jgi:hypothetical protein